jgi:hypothetical protein
MRRKGADLGFQRFRQRLESHGAGVNSHVMLLGLDPLDSRHLMRSVEHGLPYNAFEYLVANTSLSADDALALVSIPRGR